MQTCEGKTWGWGKNHSKGLEGNVCDAHTYLRVTPVLHQLDKNPVNYETFVVGHKLDLPWYWSGIWYHQINFESKTQETETVSSNLTVSQNKAQGCMQKCRISSTQQGEFTLASSHKWQGEWRSWKIWTRMRTENSKNRFRTDIAVTSSRQVPYNSHYNLISDVWKEK